jgi:hypothetical protein
MHIRRYKISDFVLTDETQITYHTVLVLCKVTGIRFPKKMQIWRFVKIRLFQTGDTASKYMPYIEPYYVKLPIISGLLVPRFFKILTIVAGSAGKLSLVWKQLSLFPRYSLLLNPW